MTLPPMARLNGAQFAALVGPFVAPHAGAGGLDAYCAAHFARLALPGGSTLSERSRKSLLAVSGALAVDTPDAEQWVRGLCVPPDLEVVAAAEAVAARAGRAAWEERQEGGRRAAEARHTTELEPEPEPAVGENFAARLSSTFPKTTAALLGSPEPAAAALVALALDAFQVILTPATPPCTASE